MHETNAKILEFLSDLGFNSESVSTWDAVKGPAGSFYIIMWRNFTTIGDRVIVYRCDRRTYDRAQTLINTI